MSETLNKETPKRRGRPSFKQNQNSATTTETGEMPSSADLPTDKTLPDDIFSEVIPENDTLPLEEKVIEKEHANLPDMPEMTETDPTGNSQTDDTEQAEDVKGSDIPHKSMEEIQSQADQTVSLMLNSYEKLHLLGRWYAKMDIDTLTKLHMEEKIDLEQSLPVANKSIKVGDFFTEYNKSIDENFIVTQEFKDTLRPPLTRIVIKREWFISDEIYVGMILGEDLIVKGAMLIGLKKSCNLVLSACMKINNNKKKAKEPETVPSANENDWHKETESN